MSSSATTRQPCLLRQRVATNDLLMRLSRHDLRLVAGDYHLQRVPSDDKGLRPHQRVAIVVNSAESLATNFNDAVAIIVDSAESLATNFNDARLSSRPRFVRRRLRRPRFVRRRLRRPRFVRRRLRRPRFVRRRLRRPRFVRRRLVG